MSPRRAYTCPKCEKDGSPRRIFVGPTERVPKCPQHRIPMTVQPNVPYKRS